MCDTKAVGIIIYCASQKNNVSFIEYFAFFMHRDITKNKIRSRIKFKNDMQL